MIIKVKKLWLGHASVREYVVNKAIRDKEDLLIEFDGTTKTYPYRSLKTHLMNKAPVEFKSKFDGKTYRLVDFPW